MCDFCFNLVNAMRIKGSDVKRLLVATVGLMFAAGAFAADTSIRGISLGNDAKEAKSKLEGEIVSGEMQAAKKMGLRGFMETMGKNKQQELRFASRPDGSIYRIRYAVKVPLSEMDAIKASLCETYTISNVECTTGIEFAQQDPRQPRHYFEASGPLDNGQYEIRLAPLVKSTNPFSGKKTYDKESGVLHIRQLAETDEMLVYKKWKQMQAGSNAVASTPIEQKKASKSYY